MTHWPVFWRPLPVPVSGASRLVPETMRHCRQKQNSFEEDDVVAAVFAFILLKIIQKKKKKLRERRWWVNMFYPAPATGASKNLVPGKYDTLDSCWRQSTGTSNQRQKTGECVITISTIVVITSFITCWLLLRQSTQQNSPGFVQTPRRQRATCFCPPTVCFHETINRSCSRTTYKLFIHIRLLKTEMTERICTSTRNTRKKILYKYKNSKNS